MLRYKASNEQISYSSHKSAISKCLISIQGFCRAPSLGVFFLSALCVCMCDQGHKISHNASTGVIEMVIEHFTRANEGTYTLQVHDGKAKNQSSLVLVGDGETARCRT